MSQLLFEEDVVFYQRLLKCMGYYQARIDGDWGPKTNRADTEFENDAQTLRDQFGESDPRTERHIRTLHIKAQEAARVFMQSVGAASFAFDVKIISGTRTYEQQNKLFAKGRFGNPGPRVTNARGGQSNHNFGIAWDIGIFKNGRYFTGATVQETNAYKRVAESVDLSALIWGGHWTSFVDLPHYQLVTDRRITQVRELFERGENFLADA